jgi:hypothetical protein
MHGFNEFAKQNGGSILHLDEDLILQKEVREEIIFWGSVYNSEFVEMPDSAFTSETAYRTWCWKTTGMMPPKRGTNAFDKYMRERMAGAATRASLPGTEYGAEVDAAIEGVLSTYTRNLKNLDEGAEWTRGDAGVWLETVDADRGIEVIIRIKWLMQKINTWESSGDTEGKVKRKDVCKRLVHYGRQVGDRECGVNRLRCTYALPRSFLEVGFEGLEYDVRDDGK